MALPRHVSHAAQQVWITNHQSSKSSAGLDHYPTPLHNDATDAHVEAHPHLFYQHFDQILSHDPNFQHSHDRGCHLLHRDHLHPVDWGATQHNSARTKALCHNRGISELSQLRYQNCHNRGIRIVSARGDLQKNYFSTLSLYQRETSTNKKQQQKANFINHPPKPVEKVDICCMKRSSLCFQEFHQSWAKLFYLEPKIGVPKQRSRRI